MCFLVQICSDVFFRCDPRPGRKPERALREHPRVLYWRVVAWGGALSTLPHFQATPASYPPVKHANSTRSRPWVLRPLAPSCRPSALGRRSGPVPVAYGLHGRWSVAPVARRIQQARATVPWVAWQTPGTCAACAARARIWRRPLRAAMAQHNQPTPPRTARPTRRIPYRSQAVRWT